MNNIPVNVRPSEIEHDNNSFIFTMEEIAVLCPKALLRMQNIEVKGRDSQNKSSRHIAFHHNYNTYFNKGSRSVSRDMRFKVLDILEKILPLETQKRTINRKIGFYGSDTAQRILATGRMNKRSAQAIIDYYNNTKSFGI